MTRRIRFVKGGKYKFGRGMPFHNFTVRWPRDTFQGFAARAWTLTNKLSRHYRFVASRGFFVICVLKTDARKFVKGRGK